MQSRIGLKNRYKRWSLKALTSTCSWRMLSTMWTITFRMWRRKLEHPPLVRTRCHRGCLRYRALGSKMCLYRSQQRAEYNLHSPLNRENQYRELPRLISLLSQRDKLIRNKIGWRRALALKRRWSQRSQRSPKKKTQLRKRKRTKRGRSREMRPWSSGETNGKISRARTV